MLSNPTELTIIVDAVTFIEYELIYDDDAETVVFEDSIKSFGRYIVMIRLPEVST
jgi:hypothetical protein